jgi:hypothetical protein
MVTPKCVTDCDESLSNLFFPIDSDFQPQVSMSQFIFSFSLSCSHSLLRLHLDDKNILFYFLTKEQFITQGDHTFFILFLLHSDLKPILFPSLLFLFFFFFLLNRSIFGLEFNVTQKLFYASTNFLFLIHLNAERERNFFIRLTGILWKYE